MTKKTRQLANSEKVTKLNINPKIEILRTRKIGLILTGGGAKGAYQIGCLKCLNDLGLNKFHIICGTSVGALNAVAVSAGRILEGVSLWSQINFSKVFKVSPGFFYTAARHLLGGFLIVNNKIIGAWIGASLLVLVVLFSVLGLYQWGSRILLISFLLVLFIVGFFMRGQRAGRFMHLRGYHLVSRPTNSFTMSVSFHIMALSLTLRRQSHEDWSSQTTVDPD